jgi:hypothetical protein
MTSCMDPHWKQLNKQVIHHEGEQMEQYNKQQIYPMLEGNTMIASQWQ